MSMYGEELPINMFMYSHCGNAFAYIAFSLSLKLRVLHSIPLILVAERLGERPA